MKCENCGKEFDLDTMETHDLDDTYIEIGCPYCSCVYQYFRNVGG